MRTHGHLKIPRAERICFGLVAAGLSLGFVPAAHSQAITLTPFATTTRGMTTVTFATGFANAGAGSSGPIGIAFGPKTPLGPPGPTGSTVIVTDPNGTGVPPTTSLFYTFADHLDGKVAGAAATPYGPATGACVGLAMVDIGAGYNYYMTQQSTGTLVQIDPTSGAIIGPVFPAGTIVGATGICPYPPGLPPSAFQGHVFISSALDPTGTIWNVNPLATPPTIVAFATGVPHPDGMCISPDGSVLYVALWSLGEIGAFLYGLCVKTS